MSTIHSRHKEANEQNMMGQENMTILFPYLSALPFHELRAWWPHTARLVLSLEAHKTPSVGKTAGACANKHVHAPLRGAFLAALSKGVADIKDECGGYSNIRTRNRRIANKVLVLTLPALRNFGILARC